MESTYLVRRKMRLSISLSRDFGRIFTCRGTSVSILELVWGERSLGEGFDVHSMIIYASTFLALTFQAG